MKVSKKTAKKIAKHIKLNLQTIDIDTFTYGLNVELEHGKKFGLTNITNDNLLLTTKIVLAHLLEFPDYYQRLYILEKKADLFWKNKQKPKLFI